MLLFVVGGLTPAVSQEQFPPTCFQNSSDSGAAAEQAIRNALVTAWARPANPGEDGAITAQVRTVGLEAIKVSWSEHLEYEVPEGATIYRVRATIATCRDYSRRVQYRVIERNYICHARVGDNVLACNQRGRSEDLKPDVERSVNKQ